jgi:hypothetical protein
MPDRLRTLDFLRRCDNVNALCPPAPGALDWLPALSAAIAPRRTIITCLAAEMNWMARDYFAKMYVAGLLADAGWNLYLPAP